MAQNSHFDGEYLSKKKIFLISLLLTLFTPFIFTINFFGITTHYTFSFFSPFTLVSLLFLSSEIYPLLLIKTVIFFFLIYFLDKKFNLNTKKLITVFITLLIVTHLIFYLISFNISITPSASFD